MGAKYLSKNSNTNTASTTVPMFCLTGGVNKRLRLYHLIAGCPIAPANQASSFEVQRTSARGTTSASFTPNPLDPADPACSATHDLTWAANPTITANSCMLPFPFNQQATFQWMVDPSNGIIVPATAGAGLAGVCVSTTSAVQYNFGIYFEE